MCRWWYLWSETHSMGSPCSRPTEKQVNTLNAHTQVTYSQAQRTLGALLTTSCTAVGFATWQMQPDQSWGSLLSM